MHFVLFFAIPFVRILTVLRLSLFSLPLMPSAGANSDIASSRIVDGTFFAGLIA